MSAVTSRRRAAILAVVAALAIAAVAVLLLRGLGGGGPPADGAAKLAPRDTLVWVHVSTDRDRDQVRQAGELAGRFTSWERLRDGVLRRLAGTGRPVTAEDVEPWLGDEAGLALVDVGGASAGSLVVMAVTDEARGRRFLERNPARSATRRYKGDRIDEFGAVNAAFKDGFLLIGQSLTVQSALDRANGRGDDLTQDPTYRRAMRGAPEDRVVDAYASAAGLRRLLVPQGDVVGSLAVLLDQPALEGVALSLVPEDEGLRVRAHSALDAAAQRRTGRRPRPFEPGLLDAVPADAMAYLGLRGISGALGNLITAAAGGGQAGGVGPLLQRLRRELSRETDGALERDLLGLLDGEVAVVIAQATPAPTLSLVTDVESEDRTAAVLRRLQAPLLRLLTPRGEAPPEWSAQDLGDGVRAWTLATPAGAEISYAVLEGRLVLGTGVDSIRRIKDAGDTLADSERFERVTEGSPDEVTSLGFLDFSQLLELGEQTGLNDSRDYLAARDDLQRIRAVGLSSRGDEGETTAEILLSIP
jgi:Protein of unknown function (DUF3352)